MTGRSAFSGFRLVIAITAVAFAPSLAPRGAQQTLAAASATSVLYASPDSYFISELSHANGYAETGEALLLSTCVGNSGTVATGSLSVELLATGGIASPSPSGPQSIGAIAPGAIACQRFTLIVSGACGTLLTPTLRITSPVDPPLDLVYPSWQIGRLSLRSVEWFDYAVSPNLPAGWTTATLSGTANAWINADMMPPAQRNRAFAADLGTTSDSVLVGPPFRVPLIGAHLEFTHTFETQPLFDGGVLEISIDGGAFQDIVATGGAFQVGGYSGTLQPGSSLAGRPAWTGSSNGAGTVKVLLPAATAGSIVAVRWRLASDAATPGTGWWIDNVIWSMPRCGEAVAADIDADRRAELALYRPSDGTWTMLKSTAGYAGATRFMWGADADAPAPGDYDGDGLMDVTVYRPSTGHWFILNSTTIFTAWDTRQWGTPGDIPAPGDFDGDKRTDPAVYRPSNATWYVLNSGGGFKTGDGHQLGASGDIPVPANYDADNRDDLALYRPSTGEWSIRLSNNGFPRMQAYQWGAPDDIPVPADYDGDWKADLAVYRPSNGTWYILSSASGFTAGYGYAWGLSTDVPVPADHDGDGRADLAVWRPSSGHWFVLKSTTAFTQWDTYQSGDAQDVPVLKPPPVSFP